MSVPSTMKWCVSRTLPMLLLLLAAPAARAEDTGAQEQATFEAAVARVAPSVVQIETIGGLEHVGEVLFGAGPTTGLVVDPRGYIISSAFNFVNKPASILVRLPGGVRKAAKLVATDHARMLVLLKIDVDKPLPVCQTAPRREMRVGQWTIAVGRTFETDRPNMAVGILSALERVWGKAIQTDAAVSPNNYGGPLLDIRGRVLGVLVPLSPDAAQEIAGIEWYDSGIGFAIPAEHIEHMLPRLKKGEDLFAGLAGISLKGPNAYSGAALIGACRPKSPAALAGFKTGDQIVEIGGRPIIRAAQVKEELGRRYAGDKVQIVVLRGQQRVQREIVLAAQLPPFQHGFLGILPLRAANEHEGITVRYVYPKGPAATAGIAAGDVITSLEGDPVASRVELMMKIGMKEPGNEVALEVRHGDAVRQVKAVLAALPEDLPSDDLPRAWTAKSIAGAAAPTGGDAKTPPKVGAMPLKVPEYPNDAWIYVPESYKPAVPYGVLVWLNAPGSFEWKDLVARWKPLCDRYDLILIVPRSADPERWTPGEASLISRLVLQAASTYHVDPTRIVVHGYEAGGVMAFLTAFRNPELVSAVAAVEAAPLGSPPDNDPLHRLAIYAAWAQKSPNALPLERAVTSLRETKLPVTVKKLGEMPRSLNPEEVVQLLRWVDTLDRI
jgi:serine protease Do